MTAYSPRSSLFQSSEIIGFNDETEGSTVENTKKKVKCGGFQAMGLSYPILKGVLKRGYKVPTPIQRKVLEFIFQFSVLWSSYLD